MSPVGHLSLFWEQAKVSNNSNNYLNLQQKVLKARARLWHASFDTTCNGSFSPRLSVYPREKEHRLRDIDGNNIVPDFKRKTDLEHSR